jgi:hypothetical protein
MPGRYRVAMKSASSKRYERLRKRQANTKVNITHPMMDARVFIYNKDNQNLRDGKPFPPVKTPSGGFDASRRG